MTERAPGGGEATGGGAGHEHGSREDEAGGRPGVAEFVEAYRRARQAEGFASADPAFARRLPFVDTTGRNPGPWRVRALHYLVVRACLRLAGARVSRVLDLGAGNGWLARRLAGRWRPVALDVDAGWSGLGAIDDPRVGRVRAEIEHLPFAARSFDAVVAAASLHYAASPARVLAEIARVLAPGGLLLVADSPVYADAVARARAQERTRAHFARLGAPRAALRYRGLTRAEIEGPSLFRFVTLAPGAWPWRRLAARLRGEDPGARLPVLLGVRRGA